jgi:hypothetical protein
VPERQGRPGTWLALFVTNHAALHNKLATNKANLLTPYTPTTEFHVTDPDGHVLRIFPTPPED